jgi:hypothetical protein
MDGDKSELAIPIQEVESGHQHERLSVRHENSTSSHVASSPDVALDEGIPANEMRDRIKTYAEIHGVVLSQDRVESLIYPENYLKDDGSFHHNDLHIGRPRERRDMEEQL